MRMLQLHIPSGKLLPKTMERSTISTMLFSWVNPLFRLGHFHPFSSIFQFANCSSLPEGDSDLAARQEATILGMGPAMNLHVQMDWCWKTHGETKNSMIVYPNVLQHTWGFPAIKLSLSTSSNQFWETFFLDPSTATHHHLVCLKMENGPPIYDHEHEFPNHPSIT